jgi:hypothetical protein
MCAIQRLALVEVPGKPLLFLLYMRHRREVLLRRMSPYPISHLSYLTCAAGEIFLRSMSSGDREGWLQCLQNSIEVYKQNQIVVEMLKNKGLLNQVRIPSNTDLSLVTGNFDST